ncbi:MAG TPA: D-2-hydroxyacid dehydrogenase [Dongiaceae bacterium]|nr:D-2-hydroxyacid dehydrogenase [Dongiaceae bacterium]
MQTTVLKIFCDLKADDETLLLLKRGVAQHEIVSAAKPAPSVLSKSEPDPALADADIAFGQPEAGAVLQAPRLRWLQISSAGYTRYDNAEFRKAALERQLLVTSSSTVYAEPCAEHVLASMLAQSRGLLEALRAGPGADSTTWLRLRNTSTLLRNQRVVILGFGSIARHLVEMLKPFSMEITALRREPKGDEGVSMVTAEHLPQALARADHVVNLLPATSGSVRFVSTALFAAMRQGSAFYNIGRGATVDQDALLAALRSGRPAAAWLDVTEPEPLPPGHPLLDAPQCFITPHIAGGHQNESQNLVRHFVENLRRFLGGAPLRDRVI